MAALSLESIIKPGQPLQLTLPPDFPQGPVRITIETLPLAKEIDLKPQTEFGKHLLEIRQQAIAKGMRLKTTNEILDELREDRDDPNLR
ncbi:hypothetical protein [Candidatus Contendibacter odensensis]|uniref:Uncharacterized protein n=1 Tax=Candidatus Contendobacter odensis Run_B_J11 TaxID=1400861 RepID=A0A7U7GGJ4_9GAMM|nr:hypothetical protein [Candidatus Contendobacter odensis]CDH47738.1 hypothetical protein BN874_920004 [Candidatus Contendobacter odensis Run_B_J11]